MVHRKKPTQEVQKKQKDKDCKMKMHTQIKNINTIIKDNISSSSSSSSNSSRSLLRGLLLQDALVFVFTLLLALSISEGLFRARLLETLSHYGAYCMRGRGREHKKRSG
jgi:hypothetical protein